MRHEFVDPIRREYCWLNTEPPGVYHPGCGELADLVVELDAFYCPACGYNGRISGAWAVACMQGDGG